MNLDTYATKVYTCIELQCVNCFTKCLLYTKISMSVKVIPQSVQTTKHRNVSILSEDTNASANPVGQEFTAKPVFSRAYGRV